MPFTAQELDNISAMTLDYHMKNVHLQSIQDKPLLKAMKAAQKTFPAGKENITLRAKGDYTTTIQGYEGDEEVGYQNPANVKEASYPWREIHAGIKITLTELKKQGISVVDSTTGARTSQASGAEKVALANILEDKMEDMSEGWSRGFNNMYWRDGTQDAKLVPGITSFVLENPASASAIGGIDQVSNTWWRNRASTGIVANLANSDTLVLVTELQNEFRQLRRYGGRPNVFLAGSDFLEQLENELRAKGTYTQTGWQKNGRIELAADDVAFKGLNVEYDPTLDDLGKAKYGYVLDTKSIYPMVMSGEDEKKHTPARPEDRYVIYRAMTWTGGMVCNRRNSSGVYSIA